MNHVSEMLKERRARLDAAEKDLRALQIQIQIMESKAGGHRQLIDNLKIEIGVLEEVLTPREDIIAQSEPDFFKSPASAWERVMQDFQLSVRSGKRSRVTTDEFIEALTAVVGEEPKRKTVRGRLAEYVKSGRLARVQDGVYIFRTAGNETKEIGEAKASPRPDQGSNPDHNPQPSLLGA
jgi:hypothetical protein